MDDHNQVRPPIFSFDRQQWPRAALLLALAAAGVILILVGNLSRPPSPTGGEVALPPGPEPAAEAGSLGAAARELESGLAEILGEVQGAGHVTVRVTLARGPRYDYAVNVSTSERQANEGGEGNRITEERTREDNLVLVQGGSGQQRPVVVEESQVQVQGVLVVADGAVAPQVRWELTRAVQTLLDVGPHQIEVLPRTQAVQP